MNSWVSGQCLYTLYMLYYSFNYFKFILYNPSLILFQSIFAYVDQCFNPCKDTLITERCGLGYLLNEITDAHCALQTNFVS